MRVEVGSPQLSGGDDDEHGREDEARVAIVEDDVENVRKADSHETFRRDEHDDPMDHQRHDGRQVSVKLTTDRPDMLLQ